jgi:hypothetical protein
LQKPQINFMNTTSKNIKYKKHYLTARPFGLFDILLILILLTISIILVIVFIPSVQGEFVEVYHNGKMIEKIDLSLNKNYTYDIDGEIIVEIKDKTARVVSNNCHSQICVQTPPISKVGEKIICAPKKFVIVVANNQEMYITG